MLPTTTFPFLRLDEVLARPPRNGGWSRSISLGTELDEGTPAISLPIRRANELFLAVHEKVVLSCGLTSDWPFGDAAFWPEALGIEGDALLAVWDYDYYVIIVATRPQPDRTAFVELRFSTHEQVTSGRLTP